MNRKRFYMIIILQVVFLVALAGSYFAIDFVGEEIKLKTEPVDPRDVIYGDYVILHYEISTIPRALWRGTGEPDYGKQVYVELRPEGVVYEAVAVHTERPTISSDNRLLKGTIDWAGRTDDMRIVYGLERFYIPEGTGREIEDKIIEGDVIVSIMMAPWGQTKINELLFND